MNSWKLQDTKSVHKKSVAFLYINNGKSENIKKLIPPLRVTSKIIKYLGINITTEVKDLHTENYQHVA